MDASLYKDYVLNLLFVKYVTDKFMGDRFAEIEIPEGGSFHDMIEAKGKSDIGDKMNKIISKLAEANVLKGGYSPILQELFFFVTKITLSKSPPSVVAVRGGKEKIMASLENSYGK